MGVDVFSFLLAQTAPTAATSATECFAALEALDARLPSTSSIDRAAAGGALADRLGYAFLAGYRAALGVLIDGASSRASLCATEAGGAHPREIRTVLEPAQGGGFTMTGKKTFATLASVADVLLVIASEGRDAERNHLRLVRIPRDRAGVSVTDRPALTFAPEIPHAEVTFDAVHVETSEVLPGDAYATVLKPFRTIEDAHVTAAWLGYAVRVLRHQKSMVEQTLALIAALRDVAARDASSPTTHLTLAGILSAARPVAFACDTGIRDDAERLRWLRDRPLLEVAGKVRELRTERAWQALYE